MFWDVVNNCIDRVLTKNQSQAIFWHRSVDSSLPDCKNPELFCIWIIYHLSLLYGYSNDGVYLQSNSSRVITIQIKLNFVDRITDIFLFTD